MREEIPFGGFSLLGLRNRRGCSVKLRPAFFVIFLAGSVALADNTPPYQKGTITISGASPKSYDLKGPDTAYQISHCADFHNGQQVDYRVKERNVYIAHEGGKESKCAIEATLGNWSGVEPPPVTYLKGTIEAFHTRKGAMTSGDAGGFTLAPVGPSIPGTVKVYRLRGPDLIYEIDYCGAFQAGQFSPGHVVEYRVVGKRLNIRHDKDKEYSCRIEDTIDPKSEVPAVRAAHPGDPSSGTTPLSTTPGSTAELSITSNPDAADIEVDGNFSGNTPSDLKVSEGEHLITVKKTGYKNRERKMMVAAGSVIHLNATMEKTTTQ